MRASGSTLDHQPLPWPPESALTRFDIGRGSAGRLRENESPLFAPIPDLSSTSPAGFQFGAFRLFPTQFLLLEGDKPVPLGSRALGILIYLVERPGELISKQELMARVWPDVFVGSTNLTVQMSALRRALRDGRNGNRFIINIHGRGYQFVASLLETPRQIALLEPTRRYSPDLDGRKQVQAFSDSGAGSVLAFPSSRAPNF